MPFQELTFTSVGEKILGSSSAEVHLSICSMRYPYRSVMASSLLWPTQRLSVLYFSIES